MEKRNSKKIQKDVKAIQVAARSAKTIKEVAEITGLTPQKIKTSLQTHPIIRARVMAALEANRATVATKAPAAKVTTARATVATKAPVAKAPTATSTVAAEDGKYIVICDAPVLTRALTYCTETDIVIPQFVYNTLVGLSKSIDYDEHKRAEDALMRIHTLHGWCTVAPKLQGETLLVEPSDEVGWRARALVALACKYWAEGYIVTIKTRTAEIAQLAKIQGVFTVDFVSVDDKATNLKVVVS